MPGCSWFLLLGVRLVKRKQEKRVHRIEFHDTSNICHNHCTKDVWCRLDDGSLEVSFGTTLPTPL